MAMYGIKYSKYSMRDCKQRRDQQITVSHSERAKLKTES